MASPSQELRVGIFTLTAAVLLCGLILLYGEEPKWFWTTHWKLEILVDTPRGIGEGTPAFLQGVQIGRVDHIELKDPAQPSAGAAVIVDIEERFDIPRGTEATLHPSFGFDKGAIHLRPPDSRTEPLPREGASVRGDTVGPLEAVVPPQFVEKLVEAVDEISKIGAVADQLVQLLEPRSIEDVDSPQKEWIANVSTAIQRFDKTLTLFNEMIAEGRDDNIPALIANLERVSGDIADWTALLNERTDGFFERADHSLSNVDLQVTEVARRMTEALDRLSRLADELQAAAAAINTGQGTVGLIMRDPKLYEEMVDAVESFRLLATDLRALVTWLETESVLRRFGW